LAITTRELAKSPELLLIEYPEEYIGQAYLDVFIQTLEDMPLYKMVVVFISNHQLLIEKFVTRSISIKNGNLVMDHQSFDV
jgi:ABC-type ATPase involved in cell division